MTKETTWYEVFKTNEDESTETIFADTDLETCVKVYRKEKIKDRSIKVDKWLRCTLFKISNPLQINFKLKFAS
jgi:hypothetical protein